MKKFTTALIAAALLAPTLSAAPALARDDHRPQHGHTVVKKKVTYKAFRKGDRFDRRYARNYQVVDYHRYRNLKAPPRGYHYVRSGNDVLLVALTSGVVASVLTGVIR